jgi:hypothetical protein
MVHVTRLLWLCQELTQASVWQLASQNVSSLLQAADSVLFHMRECHGYHSPLEDCHEKGATADCSPGGFTLYGGCQLTGFSTSNYQGSSL